MPTQPHTATTGRRLDVLQALKQAESALSIVQIATELDVHPNTVRFHLTTLVEHGQVERFESGHQGPGRPPSMFRAVAGMDPDGPRAYQLLAEVLAHALSKDSNPSLKAAEAGRSWGRALTLDQGEKARTGEARSIDHLVGLLDGLGFAPERRQDGARKQVGLRNCPFLELAQTSAEVVCPVHLGIMQGSLEAWGAPITVGRLDAFVEPDLCLAHLTPHPTASTPTGRP